MRRRAATSRPRSARFARRPTSTPTWRSPTFSSGPRSSSRATRAKHDAPSRRPGWRRGPHWARGLFATRPGARHRLQADRASVMSVQDIVLVDDDRVIQKMVGGFLERRGYQVRRASDGIEALQIIHDSVPDMIITDVRMPELNGIELTSRLRGNHRTAGVPILMFSEMGAPPDALAGYAVGADDYLPKPFELAILEAKVQSLLRRSAGAAARANRGRVILFAHAKGGVGTTCLAVNTAVLLAARSARPVGLLDLDVEFGDSAVYLNLHPNQTLADLNPAPGTVVDEAWFEGFVTESGSVRLVVGADLPERAELVTLPAIQLAIDRLSATCQHVLIAAPASFSGRTLTALDTSAVSVRSLNEAGAR